MALLKNIRQLLIPHKANGKGSDVVKYREYSDDMRYIETWAMQLVASLGAGITEITSTDGTVTVTNPFGPTTDLHAAGGGGGGYASITGPGETTTPGQITQSGDFFITNGDLSVANLYVDHYATPAYTNISNVHFSGNQIHAGGTGASSADFEIQGVGQLVFYVGRDYPNGTPVNPGPSSGIYFQIQNSVSTGTTITIGGNYSGSQDQSICHVYCDTCTFGNPYYASVNTTPAIGTWAAGSPGILSLTAPTVQVGVLNDSVIQIGQNTSRIQFFQGGVPPTGRQTVTGSRGGNAALASLLTALAQYGLIIDNSTP